MFLQILAEIAALFSVSRPTVYRSLERTTELPPLPADTRPVPDHPRGAIREREYFPCGGRRGWR